MNKKISVIITTHKGSDSVIRAVDSVLLQNYKNIEVIVVDDNGMNTPDQQKTQSVLDNYIQGKRIIYIVHEKNHGGSVARNTGFKQASGDYIGFLDDDDYYLPEKISSSINKLSSLDETWGAVYTDTIYDNGESPFQLKYKQEGDLLFEVLNHSIFINPGTTIIRRSIVEALNGFDESFERHQDYEFFTRLAAETKIAHIRKCGSVYSCAVKRHINRSKISEYRKYYLFKMHNEIQKLSSLRQSVIIAKNIVDIAGSSYGRYCSIAKEWGYQASILGYLSALYLIFKEKVFVYKCRHMYSDLKPTKSTI